MAERHELEAEDEIQAARRAVDKAQGAYAREGSRKLDALQAAETRLANAHWRWREVNYGLVESSPPSKPLAGK